MLIYVCICSAGVVPRAIRYYWLNKLRHKKVEILLASNSTTTTSNMHSLLHHELTTKGIKAFAHHNSTLTTTSLPNDSIYSDLLQLDNDVNIEVSDNEEEEGGEERSFSSSNDEEFNNGQVNELW